MHHTTNIHRSISGLCCGAFDSGQSTVVAQVETTLNHDSKSRASMKHFAKVVMAQTMPNPMQRIGAGGESFTNRHLRGKIFVQDIMRRQHPPRCRRHVF